MTDGTVNHQIHLQGINGRPRVDPRDPKKKGSNIIIKTTPTHLSTLNPPDHNKLLYEGSVLQGGTVQWSADST